MKSGVEFSSRIHCRNALYDDAVAIHANALYADAAVGHVLFPLSRERIESPNRIGESE